MTKVGGWAHRPRAFAIRVRGPISFDEIMSKAGSVRANSFTLPKRQNQISRPLIFLHFSESI